jgi:hypothetical protein
MTVSIGESICPNWYLNGSTTPLVLNGTVTLVAGGVYRTYVRHDDAEYLAFQWQQAAGGAGTIASHEIRQTLENRIEIADLGRVDIWALTPIVFTTLPAGAQASEVLPIVDVQGTYTQVEFTVGGADCTGLRFLAQVRR